MDLTVVGGGALGMGAALALAEAGHGVVLREAGTLGAGMTSRGAGVLSTMTWHDDEYRLIAATRGLVGAAVGLAAGVEPAARRAWRPLASLTIARGDRLASLDSIQDRLERHSEEPERMDWRQAAKEFPGVAFEPGEEVLVAQEDGVLDAGAFTAAMRARLAQEGVEVRENAPVDRLAGPTVVAGGAWTPQILAREAIRLPLQCFRTQCASLAGPAGTPIVHDAVYGFYARPDGEGILAGDGTVLRPHDVQDFVAEADPTFLASILERARMRFEGMGAPRSSRAGLCVATPDRRPLCGRVPGRDDLWVLTGDNGFGLMRCLALGERLAEAVGGRRDGGLDPGRFGNDWDPDFTMREGYAF